MQDYNGSGSEEYFQMKQLRGDLCTLRSKAGKVGSHQMCETGASVARSFNDQNCCQNGMSSYIEVHADERRKYNLRLINQIKQQTGTSENGGWLWDHKPQLNQLSDLIVVDQNQVGPSKERYFDCPEELFSVQFAICRHGNAVKDQYGHGQAHQTETADVFFDSMKAPRG